MSKIKLILISFVFLALIFLVFIFWGANKLSTPMLVGISSKPQKSGLNTRPFLFWYLKNIRTLKDYKNNKNTLNALKLEPPIHQTFMNIHNDKGQDLKQYNNSLEVLEWVIREDRDSVNDLNSLGLSPLQAATIYCLPSHVDLLVESGAPVGYVYKGKVQTLENKIAVEMIDVSFKNNTHCPLEDKKAIKKALAQKKSVKL